MAQWMTEFRPISLCNVCYKIISKVLCFRLKRFLPSLVSETQSAFVSGRLITDNILVAQEMFHGLNTNPRCKSEFLAFKTDMSKAYDRVEWDFLEAVMVKLGFDRKWISWIMWCVSSVSYQVLLNGQPRGYIKPQRGLRQGDPLSPYLFILCTEVLIANIKKAEREHRISGIKIARDCPTISHLLFADDSLFFCKADPAKCSTVMDIISDYGRASGQEVNLEKSSIMFGKKVPTEVRTQLKGVMGISSEGGMGSYLGIPEDLQGSKTKAFRYVSDRLDDRVNGWSAKILSKGGKEVMIKSVALALPTHVMSCYKLPTELTSRLTSVIAKFWWKSNDKERGLHWVAWDRLCKDKSEGGLGFRALEQFNDAMLAKQYWQLIHYPSSLMARVLRGRYFWNSHPLQAKKPYSPSFAWWSIFSTKGLVEHGSRWAIGLGCNVSVWRDPWIPDIQPRSANGRGRQLLPSLMVNHLINPYTKEWHMPILEEFFDPVDIQIILSMEVSKSFKSDKLIWHFTKSGKYSVKSGYRLARDLINEVEIGPTCTSLRAQVWKLQVPPKIQHFFWQIASGTLPVLERLAHQGVRCDPLCTRCGLAVETINHALFECSRLRRIWDLSPVDLCTDGFPFASIYSNLDFLFWRASSQSAVPDIGFHLPWIVWSIWKDRNKKVYQGFEAEPGDVLTHATSDKLLWEELLWEEVRSSLSTSTEPLTLEDQTPAPRCQIDGSWKASDPLEGLGWWFCNSEDVTQLLGARSQRRGPSPLHSDLHALIWAMASILASGVNCQYFETDCAELVAMVQSPDDWPAFSTLLDEFSLLRSSFPSFMLSRISRSSNVRADCLARSSRLLLTASSFDVEGDSEVDVASTDTEQHRLMQPSSSIDRCTAIVDQHTPRPALLSPQVPPASEQAYKPKVPIPKPRRSKKEIEKARSSDEDPIIELHGDSTELKPVEKVSKQAVKLKDWRHKRKPPIPQSLPGHVPHILGKPHAPKASTTP
ncbi:PREDICTED: uncharacterized protein LOC104748941 [Camelina sativa]|uniref:Uncharacterized protein LOC104748941 n=1 Tax=Camelina sativa TaxID=90675 RepID=A0ABM0WBU1_CAMSA|nr:PREDICTED: uncharacterized protein LOC104748941 [Camelina sativa]